MLWLRDGDVVRDHDAVGAVGGGRREAGAAVAKPENVPGAAVGLIFGDAAGREGGERNRRSLCEFDW